VKTLQRMGDGQYFSAKFPLWTFGPDALKTIMMGKKKSRQQAVNGLRQKHITKVSITHLLIDCYVMFITSWVL